MSVSVVGDSFVDIIVPVYDKRSLAYKGANNVSNIRITCGGTANIAVFTSRLGIPSKFFGKVGNDLFGLMFKMNLKGERVEDLTLVDRMYHTGVCISLVDTKKERTMIVYRGANDNITIRDIQKCESKILSPEVKLMFFTGFSLQSKTTSSSVFYLMEKAQDREITICFNPGAYNIINPLHFEVLKKYCNVLFLNMDEGIRMTGKRNPQQILAYLRERYKPHIVILTIGSKGVVVGEKRGDVKRFPAKKVRKVLDTTGAGDAFSAGFLVGLLKGYELKRCVMLGSKLSAKVIERIGVR
jgi:sugar/nucleoside kinase (ribokinase family)